MNTVALCRKCGEEFTTNPKVGTAGIVKCPRGHATVVRQATQEEAQALTDCMDRMNKALAAAAVIGAEGLERMQEEYEREFHE